MKKKEIIFVFFAVMLALGLTPASFCAAAGGNDSAAAQASPFLTPEDAQRKIGENGQLFLLDVRSPQEFAERHLPGATLIPLPELAGRVAELPADRPILLYCRSGKRASKAYETIKTMRPELTEIFVVNGFPIY